MPRRKRNIVISLAMLAGIASTGASSAWLWHRHDETTALQAELASTIVALEQATGYTGFIHNFKNAVLRPLEPAYLDLARADFTAANAAIDRLEQMARAEGITLTLHTYRSTLQRYRDNIEALTGFHYDSTTIDQADAMARLPDGAARTNLDHLTQRLTQHLEDEARPLRQGLLASLSAMLVLITLLLREQSYNARMREQHVVFETQKHLLEVERRYRRELSDSLAHVRQVNREQAEISYAISHDLKSPANTAAMLVGALREDLDGTLKEEPAELLDDLDTTLRRMSTLVEDLLSYTRALDSDLPRAEVALDTMVDDVLAMLRAEIHASGAKVQRRSLPSFSANPPQIRNLVQNLLQNALKFRRPDIPPLIEIFQVEAEPGRVAFAVRDNGIGIPEDQQEKIFGLFGRLQRRDEYEGSGLGLPISLRIAHAHGGNIAVTSTPGQGTTFTVTLKAT
ncbi:sensor histidine kinase [Sagittula salina]|uniref:histidine kinase n=1 Tax=Sagittula salina TaxID=2820268 RepID=A0A940S2E3_9RHOB|nr:ATP-binding protein [Sagittula salina]MBP0481924.1 hypothetical protein [Sagittula salina]